MKETEIEEHNDPTTVLKVPEGFLKICRKNKILSDMVFFYQLKSINKEGYFKKEGFAKMVSERFSISEPSLFRKLKRLIDLGIVVNLKFSYNLISYHKLWDIFGYDLSVQKTKKKRFRRGNFRLVKLNVQEYLSNFVNYCDFEEINLNIRRQNYEVGKYISEKKRLDVVSNRAKMDVTGNILTYRPLNTNIDSDPYYLDEYLNGLLKYQVSKKLNLNLMPTISCVGLCELLGFKSTSCSYKLLQRIERLNFCTVFKQRVFLGKEENQTAAIRKVRELKRFSQNFIWSFLDKSFYFNLPNYIEI